MNEDEVVQIRTGDEPVPLSWFRHPDPDPVHIPGDPLGRTYTPQHVADAIMARLDPMLPRYPSVLEPCVGGGAFVRAAQGIGARYVVGVDIDPLASGRHLCHEFVVHDFSRIRWARACDLSVTNPPFGRAVGQDVTLAIAHNAIGAADVCALLLPVDVLTQVGWAELIAIALEVWPIVGRVWDHERGMVVLVWHHDRSVLGPAQVPTVFRPLAV
jgi:hypothetical protein